MLSNWTLISKDNLYRFRPELAKLEVAEYFHSSIYQMYSKMYFKYVQCELVICKAATIMGNYSFIRYCYTDNSETVKKALLDSGFTLRGSDIEKGTKDKFGDECIYSTDECIQLKGKPFARFRNILRRYNMFEDTTIQNGYDADIDVVVHKWSFEHKSNHQIKLLKFIKENLELVQITRIYYKNTIVGFSVVERLNDANGVIIQRLINPDIKSLIIEPNILIHYADCYSNPGMFLNIGASRNKKIKVAKDKLRPFTYLKIRRNIAPVKLNKGDWQHFKEHLLID